MILHPTFLPWQGFCPWPGLILIHRSRRGDESLIVHERTHEEQMREHGWARFVWRYLTRPMFRMAMEVQAYRAQMAAGGSLSIAAHNLSTGYYLDLTFAQALEMLS